MKQIILRILSTLILAGIILGVVLRVFQLAAYPIPYVNINGNRLLKPGSEGYFIRGGLGEIRSHYTINSQGWNSTIDYEQRSNNKIRIAIIGDSYIEGFHVDAENSIGRILESISTDYQVHEFGISEANVVDYSLIYNKWVKNKYDYTFVWINNNDLNETSPGFMSSGSTHSESSLIRRIFHQSFLLRYFYINKGLGDAMSKFLQKCSHFIDIKEKTGEETMRQNFMDGINMKAVSELGTETIFLYEPDRLNQEFTASFNCLGIEHHLQPKSNGFDGHWNLNGRINCANTIDKFIRSIIQN